MWAGPRIPCAACARARRSGRRFAATPDRSISVKVGSLFSLSNPLTYKVRLGTHL
jgi:hypothetical protein